MFMVSDPATLRAPSAEIWLFIYPAVNLWPIYNHAPWSASPHHIPESSIPRPKKAEPQCQRPGMYIRTDNPLHIIQEVLDNAADEALAGQAKRIRVTPCTAMVQSASMTMVGASLWLHPQEQAPWWN